MSDESKAEAQAFSARPEARFALAAGVLGALISIALTVLEFAHAPGPTSAVAYVYLPFVAICAAVIAGVWGIALGCVWFSVTGRQVYFRAVIWLAWALVVGAPITLLLLLLA